MKTVSEPGLYGDGHGLWLQVGPTGGKSWAFRYQLNRSARQMGLGPIDVVTLAEARDLARDAHRLLVKGLDPIDERDRSVGGRRRQQRSPSASGRSATSRQWAERYIPPVRGALHRQPRGRLAQLQARRAMAQHAQAYAYPVLGDLPVDAIDTGLVLRVVEPIWSTKSETAGRVRGRIESVLSWAKVADYRAGDNPARWRGHFDQLLPVRRKVRRVRHHAALPYREMPAFVTELRDQPGMAARALELTILCATRTSETLDARWTEIDGNLWTIPPERMKGGRAHRVPLSSAALDLLASLPQECEYLFPGARQQKSLSNMAMTMVLRRMGRGNVTVHGMRSAFRDWAAEVAHAPREVAEAALAHAVGDEVEAAYQRADLLERRRG